MATVTPSGLLKSIVPPAVVVAELLSDGPFHEPYSCEIESLGRVSCGRRRHFEGGRHCSREALDRLGIEHTGVPIGHEGRPVWPQGVVGSITHRQAYSACAVALEDEFYAVGIDAEPNVDLKPATIARVASSAELNQVAALSAANPEVQWTRLLFSAKEAGAKALAHLHERIPPLHSVVIDFEADGAVFAVGHPDTGPQARSRGQLEGRWTYSQGMIVTAVTCTAS